MASIEELRTKELSRLTAYQDTFTGGKGPQVLKDLQERFLFPLRSREHAAAGNGEGLAYIAGQRELLINIMAWVTCDPVERVDSIYPEQEDEPDAGQSDTRINPSDYTFGDT